MRLILEFPFYKEISKTGRAVYHSTIPTSNETHRWAYTQGGRRIRHTDRGLRALTKALLRQAVTDGGMPRMDNAIVTVFLYAPDNRKRDTHNLHIKAVLDELTLQGLWIDDKQITVTYMPMLVDRDRPRVELVISDD